MRLHDRNVICQVSKLPDWNLNLNGESHTLNHTLDHLALQQGSGAGSRASVLEQSGSVDR